MVIWISLNESNLDLKPFFGTNLQPILSQSMNIVTLNLTIGIILTLNFFFVRSNSETR